MKIVTILGARPQFIKSWAVSTALGQAGIDEVIVHTGQHYDESLSGRFFEELQLTPPSHHLGVGSGPHGRQTGRMLESIEQVLLLEKPDRVIVYGDTNSTLAGALAAAKLHLPLAHIEAGLRSFNRRMPEEINRVMTDHLSALLFCPSAVSVENLHREGVIHGVHLVGDVMQDSLRHFAQRAEATSPILDQLGLKPESYHVATIHRAELTDDPDRLCALLGVLAKLDHPVLLPLHPRTRARLAGNADIFAATGRLRLIDPLGYLDMLKLVANCHHLLTDSGGLQKEAYWLARPCLTLRPETEWVETLATGWNILTADDPARINAALQIPRPLQHPELYGDGHAAEAIAGLLGLPEKT